jgi:hypothetical protein
MSIFQDPTKGPAERSKPAKGSLSGYQKPEQNAPPLNHHGSSVEHVPNADRSDRNR